MIPIEIVIYNYENKCNAPHGTFFDELLKIAPTARILSTLGGEKIEITKDYGNWQDFNIGSSMQPTYASEACECTQT